MRRTFILTIILMLSAYAASAQVIFKPGDPSPFYHKWYYHLPEIDNDSAAMRLVNGKLYIGSCSRFGAMKAEYVAFNQYGELYFIAKKRRTWGHTLTWLGASMFSTGLLSGSVNLDFENGTLLLMGVGAAAMGAGIPLLCNGNKILKGIASDYNSHLAQGREPELTFGPCRNGIGLALNF